MQQRILLWLCLSLFGLQGLAQEVQWASEVIKVSSSMRDRNNPKQYQARQALGAPSIRSDFGASTCAWAADRPDDPNGAMIAVGFAEPQQVQQILIHENYHAGAIQRITLRDINRKLYVVYENDNPTAAREEQRLFKLKIDRTDYDVDAIRIELATAAVPGFNQIDAIGIADHQEDYEIKINVAPDLEPVAPPRNLGPLVNSPAEELCPVIAPDGKTLYFVRQNHPENIGPNTQDIWYSEFDAAGKPQAPVNVGEPLNNQYHTALTSITPDGQTALLLNVYKGNGDMGVGVSTARRGKEGWEFPDSLRIKDFYNSSQSGEYVLSSTGRVLIMAVQRVAGSGGKDLFISFRQPNGNWTRPKWMGPTLNTADDEASPFLAADDRTLYFATAGRPGYGDKDMYVTRRLGDSWLEWSEPENLGPVLNTPGWDAYYSVPASGKYVYFVSYREGNYGRGDIYRATLPPPLRPRPVVLVTGTVTNQKTGEPLGTRIEYTSLTTGKSIGEAHSDPVTGAYSIVLPAGDLFGFYAAKTDFLPVSEDLDLRTLTDYEEVRQDLELVPIEKGARIVMNNIFFDFAKDDLRMESSVELKQLAGIMQRYPSMRVEISGHTDNVGSDADNQKLSENRAQAVVAFLTEQGIVRDRLEAKGMGEQQPAAKNDTAEHRQQNRRVEFKILSL